MLADPAVREFPAAAAAGWPQRVPGLISWEAPTFTVDSGAPIDLGIDGETLRMTPPLGFTIGPGALRIRLP